MKRKSRHGRGRARPARPGHGPAAPHSPQADPPAAWRSGDQQLDVFNGFMQGLCRFFRVSERESSNAKVNTSKVNTYSGAVLKNGPPVGRHTTPEAQSCSSSSCASLSKNSARTRSTCTRAPRRGPSEKSGRSVHKLFRHPVGLRQTPARSSPRPSRRRLPSR